MPEVRVCDREAPDQADGPVYHHAQATEEHRSKSVPVAACYIISLSMSVKTVYIVSVKKKKLSTSQPF